MRYTKLALFGIAILSLLAIGGCGDTSDTQQTYDGRVFDISVSQDKSLTATSNKDGNNYTLTISGEGQAIDYERKELVPWNPIIKKINKVTIEEGITNIGDYFFFSLPLTR